MVFLIAFYRIRCPRPLLHIFSSHPLFQVRFKFLNSHWGCGFAKGRGDFRRHFLDFTFFFKKKYPPLPQKYCVKEPKHSQILTGIEEWRGGGYFKNIHPGMLLFKVNYFYVKMKEGKKILYCWFYWLRFKIRCYDHIEIFTA